MSNTQLRIISALVLMVIVGACLWAGEPWTLGFVAIAALIVIDEIFTNFLKAYRHTSYYILSVLFFIGPYLFFHFVEVAPGYYSMFVNGGIALNALLIFFLFKKRVELGPWVDYIRKIPFSVGLFVLIPVMSLTSMVQYEQWRTLLVILLLVNFGMDTGAWFFGKRFGRHKLWPAVSPNKTIEGLIGGILVACCLGSLSWLFFMGPVTLGSVVIFALLGGLSQLGDLVQSKLKRCFDIKDSSALIPGHGGVYDRVDSLLFLAPFYALAVGQL
jgi:phosphatidate cytidylyltransferase